jgi:hypothetical protein
VDHAARAARAAATGAVAEEDVAAAIDVLGARARRRRDRRRANVPDRTLDGFVIRSTLIRMTSLPRVSSSPRGPTWARLPRAGDGSARGWLAAVAIVVLAALAVIGAVAGASANAPADGRQRVAVVVDASQGPAAVAAARRAVRDAERTGADVRLRLPRTSAEQLGSTHLFAARGYDLVIGAGISRRTAVAPVAARYPQTRFALVAPDGIAPALARAVR